jgi:Ca-activated chloride channel homolog
VRMNVLLVANDLAIDSKQLALNAAAVRTGGILLLGQTGNFSQLLSDRFFSRFNSNLKWIIFWLGMAWVALMWLVVLPLDRWILQAQVKLPMNLSGQIALGHALFWSVLTPILIWCLSGLPLASSCS